MPGPETRKRRHVRLLLALVGLELAVLGHLWIRNQPAKVIMGFLIKNGSQYTVAWKREKQDYETRDYASLKDALKFVRSELKLSEGRNPIPEHELEHVWVDSRFGGTVLLWKSLRYTFLNQLTFQNSEEAGFFLKAFRRGAYAPSIFGHSIVLTPERLPVN